MTYDVRPKRKNRVFEKKFKCGIVPKCGIIFKNLSEESRSLFGGINF